VAVGVGVSVGNGVAVAVGCGVTVGRVVGVVVGVGGGADTHPKVVMINTKIVSQVIPRFKAACLAYGVFIIYLPGWNQFR
jgi:hypothetical protein